VILHDLTNVDQVVTKLQDVADSAVAIIAKNEFFDTINGFAVLIEDLISRLN